MRQGKYVVVDGKFIHVKDLWKNKIEQIGACVLIVLFILMSLMY